MSQSTATWSFSGYRPTRAVNYIKRVVGLPGDVVDYEQGSKQLTINGQPIAMELLGDVRGRAA